MNTLKMFAFADEASLELNGQIAAMKRNGLDGLEIRNLDTGNVSDMDSVRAKEVRKILEEEGLSVWSIGSPIGKIDIVSDDYKAHLEKFRNTLEIANILGAENLRMFSFYIPQGETPEKYKNEVIDRLGEMVEIAQGSGIVLCHENEKGIYG
ncbi:MAG: sugar phosphate isomerase/epimerase, partial [Acetatifactor sp.]|nr:sugar phosphate isomerase/epimerase [Acetatifactor sp.]